MKIRFVVALIPALLTVPASLAQAFTSGSTGSDGALEVTNKLTLQLPPNGIFNFTTITIPVGKTLRFQRNALNTPVYLLATGDVNIAGVISLDGEDAVDGVGAGRAGGPGGFDGGQGGFGGPSFGGTGLGADGQGPGGGKANSSETISGAFAAPVRSNTNTYGNTLLVPLIGGSGGAGENGTFGRGGGGGGGAILIASSTRIQIDGVLQSRGGAERIAGGIAGGGSGGAIRLVAPVVTGVGWLDAGPDARKGRVRVDCLDSYFVRTLNARESVWTRGSQMYVFPPVVPRLDIIEAAGQSIPVGTGNQVMLALPKGTSNQQAVTVQAAGFTNDIFITVAVTPSDRPSTNFQAILRQTDNPPTISIPITLAVDSTNRIMIWATY